MGIGFVEGIGKKVFIICKSGTVYKGKLLEVHDAGNGLFFLTLKNIFNKFVVVSSNVIDRFEVESDDI